MMHSFMNILLANELTGNGAGGSNTIDTNNRALVEEICARFNSRLIFEPDRLQMAYTVRDPVINSTFKCDAPRGFVNEARVHDVE